MNGDLPGQSARSNLGPRFRPGEVVHVLPTRRSWGGHRIGFPGAVRPLATNRGPALRSEWPGWVHYLDARNGRPLQLTEDEITSTGRAIAVLAGAPREVPLERLPPYEDWRFTVYVSIRAKRLLEVVDEVQASMMAAIRRLDSVENIRPAISSGPTVPELTLRIQPRGDLASRLVEDLVSLVPQKNVPTVTEWTSEQMGWHWIPTPDDEAPALHPGIVQLQVVGDLAVQHRAEGMHG